MCEYRAVTQVLSEFVGYVWCNTARQEVLRADGPLRGRGVVLGPGFGPYSSFYLWYMWCKGAPGSDFGRQGQCGSHVCSNQ